MEFILFIGGIILLIMFFSLRNRVAALEFKVKKLTVGQAQKSQVMEASPVAEQAQAPSEQPKPLPLPPELLSYIERQKQLGVPIPVITNALTSQGWQQEIIAQAMQPKTQEIVQTEQPDVAKQDALAMFSAWLKENWLMKLGALLLLIGFGWLTTYAFMNNWIGPMGRIALGIAAGAIILILGWWRIFKYVHQGGVFLVLGSTVILLTTFAAREMYGFFTPTSALVMMFISVLFVGVASVKFNSKALALASLILAGLAPLFTAAPKSDYVGLFSYLLIVVLGTIWIVVLTGNRELTAAALLLVAFYSIPHWLGLQHVDKSVLFFFAYVLGAVFFITNTAGILKIKDRDLKPDILCAAGNALFLLAWIESSVAPEWKSIIIASWMLIFAVGAFIIFRMTGKKQPFLIYSGISIVMLGAATAAELSGPALVIAFILEAAVISAATYIITQDIHIAQRLNALFAIPIIMSLPSFGSGAWNTGVFHRDFAVLLLLGVSMMLLGLFYINKVKDAPDEAKNFNAAMIIVGSYYLYALLWLSLHAAFGPAGSNTAVAIAMVIYTIIGLICYFYGQAISSRTVKIYGGILIGFVVGRLLLIDIWNVAMPVRIVMFFLIGALLMSTAFIGRKKS